MKVFLGPAGLASRKSTEKVRVGIRIEAGVLEYVVRTIEPDQIFWYCQAHGVLAEQALGADGPASSTF